MVNIRLFIYFFKKENLFNLLLFFSTASLLFVGDIFFLFYLSRLMGVYLAFSLFFLISAIGQISIFRSFSCLLDQLTTAKQNSDNCFELYLSYAGTFPTLIYMIYPGIISTLVGYILLLPPIRIALGSRVSSYFDIDWDEINEYLFLLM